MKTGCQLLKTGYQLKNSCQLENSCQLKKISRGNTGVEVWGLAARVQGTGDQSLWFGVWGCLAEGGGVESGFRVRVWSSVFRFEVCFEELIDSG